jgi:hypothetical protein
MLFVCFQAFRFDACLTFGALGPAGTGSFVSTDVYKLRREYLGDFCHYIFKKLHALFVADAQYIFKDTPVGRYFVRSSGASHIRIGGQSGKYETRPEVSLSLPEEFPLYRPDGIYQVSELRNYFYQQAEELALRYDARNGNSGYMDRLKDLMSN